MAGKQILIDYAEYLELEEKSNLVDELRKGVSTMEVDNQMMLRKEATLIIPNGDKLLELIGHPHSPYVNSVKVILDKEERKNFQQRAGRGYYHG